MKTIRSDSGAVRKISRMGKYSYFVTLPKSVVKELGWRSKQKVVIRRVGKKIVIEDWVK